MIYPSIGKLMKGMDSRYTLVMAVAKRARAIAGENPDKGDNDKSVRAAVDELARGEYRVVDSDEGEE